MNVKEFSNYNKACEFRDKVGGQVEWSSYKANRYGTCGMKTRNAEGKDKM